MQQRNISAKNIARLETLCKSEDSMVAELAHLVLQVAKIKPHKRRRVKILARENRELLYKLHELNLVEVDSYTFHEILEPYDDEYEIEPNNIPF